MLDLETLSIADIYLWLGSGYTAGEHVGCHQATISRIARKVKRLSSSLMAIGGEDLLQMEREIHQKLRFMKGNRLRLHAYQWTNYLIRQGIPENWEMNPLGVSGTKIPGLRMLKERIIDAICAPYPLVANADWNTFSAICLYKTHLQLFTRKDGILAEERNLSKTDIQSATRLGTLGYVPIEASECSKTIDAQMFGCNDPHQDPADYDLRYWGTPLTPIISEHLQPISYVPLCPYAEYLVVRKEWEHHPLVAKLQESILKSVAEKISNHPTNEVVEIER